MDTRSFILLSGKPLYFFLGLCDYSGKFPKMFCSSCGMERPSITNFCHQLNLSEVSNKGASSVDKDKLIKKYFHRGYPYAALIMCTMQVTPVADVLKYCGPFYIIADFRRK